MSRWWMVVVAMIFEVAALRATTTQPSPEKPRTSYVTRVKGKGSKSESPPGRASTVVTRADMERRQPRSAPDALRYEPGVFVQQTAHSQGSAYIRGLTGQQTLMLFDGIRLNNSTYRQGPNQYFFTLDARTIESIEVMRGGGSTRRGSDALGGVIMARPVDPPAGENGPEAHARISSRLTTADREGGGRVQVEVNNGYGTGVVAGVGGRKVQQLLSGGMLKGISGEEPMVPRFAPDGRTQLGTGFRELTADARMVHQVTRNQRLTTAVYLYRQYDAPRTDQCPPPFARYDECLTYEQQFRTLAYGAWEGRLGGVAERARITWSWQRQHERRSGKRPASVVNNMGEDDVDTFGITAHATTAPWVLVPGLRARIAYGVDTYVDRVKSKAWIEFSDVGLSVPRKRGQYLDGSTYGYGGTYVDGELEVVERVMLRAGTRFSWIKARAPADPDSGTLSVDQVWLPVVGHVGAEWRVVEPVSLMVNLDRSFRAPNLDDLTSRQQTGPGFQFENAALKPEQATTFEVGMRHKQGPLDVQLWAFRTLLLGAMTRQPRTAAQCPPQTPECQASWNRFQLVNANTPSELKGVEGAARLWLPTGLMLRLSASWVRGEGPNLAERPTNSALAYQETVPLSRVPPLHGTAEWHQSLPVGLGAGLALRWAAGQDRLAVADRSDARIPPGGTPGFAVVDARLTYRAASRFSFSAVVENVFDRPYRYHGSSVNGAGRGLLLSVEGAPL